MGILVGGASQRLKAVRDGLLTLHGALVSSERAVYERDVERVRSSYHMLGLLMNDPWFAWLHDLSRLIVEIDEALDEKEAVVTPADAERFIGRATSLVSPQEHGEGFGRRYFEAMQRDPDVILAHRKFRTVLEEDGQG